MSVTGLFYPWGSLPQAVALGALGYIVAEAAPDASLLRGPFDAMGRRRRIRDLEAVVLDNPSVGNLEELADQYLDNGQCARAEAREWAGRILAKKPSMPRYLRRRERPWFRKAAALLKQFSAR